jgi:hypothetical protein
MIIQGIGSELWWIGNVDEIRSPKPFSVHDIFRSFPEVFHFFGVPTTFNEESYTFQQGELILEGGKVSIAKLVIYNSGVHITVLGDSAGADAVLQKLKEIFQGLGMREPVTPSVSFYRSTIVCDFDKAPEPLFSKLEAITSIIQKAISAPAKLHASGIAFVADPETLPRAIAGYNPTLFSINRKTDVEFSKNRCTCFANLNTVDHLATLEAIEHIL